MPYYYRVCRPLVLYEKDSYRVWRDGRAKIYIQQYKEYTIHEGDVGFNGVTAGHYWQDLTIFWGATFSYAGSSRKRKLALNKKFAAKGKAWIDRWKLLLSSSMWEVKCDDWDGQGTPCPIQREREDGTLGCPIRFFFMGYSGSYPASHPLPGKCTGPLNYKHGRNPCVPSGSTNSDKHGFSMLDLARVRNEIWQRGT